MSSAEEIAAMKALVAYSNQKAFSSKWLVRLTEGQLDLVEAFASDCATWKSPKATASYKSLVARFLVTGRLAEGKSGDSMKSAVRAYIAFCEGVQAAVELSELDS